jgi:hypothetical protein
LERFLDRHDLHVVRNAAVLAHNAIDFLMLFPMTRGNMSDSIGDLMRPSDLLEDEFPLRLGQTRIIAIELIVQSDIFGILLFQLFCLDLSFLFLLVQTPHRPLPALSAGAHDLLIVLVLKLIVLSHHTALRTLSRPFRF